MIEIPMRVKGAVDQRTLLSVGEQRVRPPYTAQTILAVNERTKEQAGSRVSGEALREPAAPREAARPSVPMSSARPALKPMPRLIHQMQKGQKMSLAAFGALPKVEIRLGWNTDKTGLEVDVSAFLLGEDGKVIGDDWFVFYGQTKSPDGSVVFSSDGGEDREVMYLDVARLHAKVKKIVFVLTIHEALEKRYHFGMVRDAYIRILDAGSRQELVSFQMTESYTNVISMMIGEIYLYKDMWKFHGIGNGVARDLAGLCALYGVEVSGS